VVLPQGLHCAGNAGAPKFVAQKHRECLKECRFLGSECDRIVARLVILVFTRDIMTFYQQILETSDLSSCIEINAAKSELFGL
jgi:hypothetical protein